MCSLSLYPDLEIDPGTQELSVVTAARKSVDKGGLDSSDVSGMEIDSDVAFTGAAGTHGSRDPQVCTDTLPWHLLRLDWSGLSLHYLQATRMRTKIRLTKTEA